METMAKMEFSRRELELLISATAETIVQIHANIRKYADLPDAVKAWKEEARDLEYLRNDLVRARETVLP